MSHSVDDPVKARVSALRDEMTRLGPFRRDILSLDNTNTIEGYFNTIKRRTPSKTATLLDIFNAVTFTEESALAANHPSSRPLPNRLADCLSAVISREVLWMMSTTGVHAFLNCLVSSINVIISNRAQTDEVPIVVVQTHLLQGRVINTFMWMPNEWLLSLDEAETTHDSLF